MNMCTMRSNVVWIELKQIMRQLNYKKDNYDRYYIFILVLNFVEAWLCINMKE